METVQLRNHNLQNTVIDSDIIMAHDSFQPVRQKRPTSKLRRSFQFCLQVQSHDDHGELSSKKSVSLPRAFANPELLKLQVFSSDGMYSKKHFVSFLFSLL
ncbi:Hypothetical predicted protein [Cloeon dipterum]|uniref:Uncharacterized protein n=1 Tax=Cloeon dipterum TaxID=197152 RepID=A0A8S1CKM8_9INSE|nr:Hypothetical predicted protein [Cloeon dipterum]